MMPEDIEKKYIDSLTLLEDPGSQCEYLLMLGLARPARESVREDRYQIGGCKTAIWLKAWLENGRLRVSWDSDSLLVKGVLAILEDMYAGKSPQEVKAHPPCFLDHISDDVIYPEIKQNGISKCFQRLATLTISL